MSYWTGRITVDTTGNNLYTSPGFTATWIRLTVGARNGASSVMQYSCGRWDGTRKNYQSLYADGSGQQTKEGNDKALSHYERVSGALTEVLNVTGVSVSSNGNYTLTSTVGNPNYKVDIELGD